jgi:hypothetical protein
MFGYARVYRHCHTEKLIELFAVITFSVESHLGYEQLFCATRRRAAKRVRQGWAACRFRPTRKNRNAFYICYFVTPDFEPLFDEVSPSGRRPSIPKGERCNLRVNGVMNNGKINSQMASSHISSFISRFISGCEVAL